MRNLIRNALLCCYRSTGFVLCFVGLLLASGCDSNSVDAVPTTTGATVALNSNDWLVVNYWAEWCGPCRHEIPELNELDQAPASLPGDLQVTVLGVNYDGLRDQKLIDVGQRMGIEFAVLTDDPRERWGQPTPAVLPSTYLVAPGGEFVETLVGPQTRAGILSRIGTLAEKRAAGGE